VTATATPVPATSIAPSRLRGTDVLRSGASALTTRKLRAALSALGISIGIAALVGVLGLSASSRADLDAQLDELGTDMLTVEAGGALGGIGGNAALSADAAAMIERLGPVGNVSAFTAIEADGVRRTEYINEDQTGGVTVASADLDVLTTLRGEISSGRWHDAASEQYPTVVLGAVAAERLGLSEANGTQTVVIGDDTFTVIGILEPLPLAQDIDRTAIVGTPIGQAVLDAPDTPSKVYLRVDNTQQMDALRDVLPATANPEAPDEVTVSRPSDALEAQVAAETTFTSLFLGLGAVALLVGGIGIANVMVISVIERRGEIGLRRAMGATRPHISRQFLVEAIILSGLGGIAGVGIGIGVTALYSRLQGWQTVIPPSSIALGLVAAMAIGAIAGLFPAIRAARLAPTEALRGG
jgi:putative ABC transport system permease protein